MPTTAHEPRLVIRVDGSSQPGSSARSVTVTLSEATGTAGPDRTIRPPTDPDSQLRGFPDQRTINITSPAPMPTTTPTMAAINSI